MKIILIMLIGLVLTTKNYVMGMENKPDKQVYQEEEIKLLQLLLDKKALLEEIVKLRKKILKEGTINERRKITILEQQNYQLHLAISQIQALKKPSILKNNIIQKQGHNKKVRFNLVPQVKII